MIPHFQVAHVLLGAGGQGNAVVREAECFKQFKGQFENAADLLFDLLRTAEDVGVVLREATDPHQAVQHSTTFVAVDCAQLGEAQGQFPVAS